MIDYGKVSEALFGLLNLVLIPLAGYGVSLLIAKGKLERAKLSQQNQWLMDRAVEVAIFAAEQMYKTGQGDAKKAYAIQVAEDWLAKYNISMDLHLLEAAIEAAVKQQFDKPALSAQA